jgi:hypothetical protein
MDHKIHGHKHALGMEGALLPCAILQSAGAASSLSASLRLLRGAQRGRAGLTRLPLRSRLVSTKKNGLRK